MLKETTHGCYIKRIRRKRRKQTARNVKKFIQYLNRSDYYAKYTYIGKRTRRKKHKAERIAHKKNMEIYEQRARAMKHEELSKTG